MVEDDKLKHIEEEKKKLKEEFDKLKEELDGYKIKEEKKEPVYVEQKQARTEISVKENVVDNNIDNNIVNDVDNNINNTIDNDDKLEIEELIEQEDETLIERAKYKFMGVEDEIVNRLMNDEKLLRFCVRSIGVVVMAKIVKSTFSLCNKKKYPDFRY